MKAFHTPTYLKVTTFSYGRSVSQINQANRKVKIGNTWNIFFLTKTFRLVAVTVVLTHPQGNQVTKGKNLVPSPQNLTVQVSDKRQENIYQQ